MHHIFCLAVVISTIAYGVQPLSDWCTRAQGRFVTEVLPNGVTIICYPMPGTYKVHVGVTYDVGAKNERPHECGLAHMVEHMIFKGTDKISESGLKVIAQKYLLGNFGGGYNAATTHDLTRYYFHADKTNWQLCLTILADCMFNVRFDEDHVASEAQAIVEELNLRATNLFALIGDQYGSLIYPHGHPYHHPVGGYKEVVLSATGKDLKAFYERNYHPQKALVTVVGDIQVDEVLAYARSAFASEPSKIPADTQVCEIPTADFSRKKVILYTPIPHEQYTYLFKIPHEPCEHAYAQFLSWVLNNRLEKLLIHEKDLVFSVVSETLHSQFGGVFLYTFEPKQASRFKEIKGYIEKELERLMQDGSTDKELERYKKISEVDFLRVFESASSIANMVEHEFFPSRSLDSFFLSLDRRRALSQDGLRGFIKHYLRPTLSFTLICLPIPEEEKTEWLKKKSEQDTYEQTLLQGRMRQSDIDPVRFDHELPEQYLAPYVSEYPDRVITLKNGLEVHLKKRDMTPFVSAVLRFKHPEAFSIHLSLQDTSMTRLFAMNMIPFGTVRYSKEQNQEFFDLKGAHAVVSPSGCFVSCLPQDLGEVVARGVEILKTPRYDQKMLSQEVHSLTEQLKKAQMQPGYVADRSLRLEIFKEYPWIKSDNQLLKELKVLTRADLIAFNKAYLNPQNMFLVVVGNFDADTIQDDLERACDQWKQDKVAHTILNTLPVIPDISAQEGTEQSHVLPVDQVYLVFGRVTNYAESKEVLALMLIESYVQDKIFEIREQSGAFYAFQIAVSGATAHQKGFMEIMVPLSVGNVEKVQKMIIDILKRIAQEGIPQEVLDTAKHMRQVRLLKSCATHTALAEHFAAIIADDKPMDFYEKRLAQIQALTKEEVDATVRTYLDPKSWTLVKAGRLSEVSKGEYDEPLSTESSKSPGGFFSWLSSWF